MVTFLFVATAGLLVYSVFVSMMLGSLDERVIELEALAQSQSDREVA